MPVSSHDTENLDYALKLHYADMQEAVEVTKRCGKKNTDPFDVSITCKDIIPGWLNEI